MFQRGLPHHVYSDNGSNFVGANNRLKEIYNFINTSNLKECVTNWAAPKEIRWSFLPSRAPHFGGLWKAAVKSMKLLLQKTLGGCKLRFDEMTTVLTEVEAMLNSRPLVPLDSVATDGIAPFTGTFSDWSSTSSITVTPGSNFVHVTSTMESCPTSY